MLPFPLTKSKLQLFYRLQSQSQTKMTALFAMEFGNTYVTLPINNNQYLCNEPLKMLSKHILSPETFMKHLPLLMHYTVLET